MCVFRHHMRRLAAALAAGARAAAIAPAADAVTVRDAGGRTVEVKDASRIVVGRRRRHRDPLCARPRRPDRGGRHHQPVSGRGAEAEAECRLHARALGRGRARPQSVAGAGDRGRGPEGDRSRCWKPRPCRWCACRTATPATASWRRSSWSPTWPASTIAASASRAKVGGRSRGAGRRCAQKITQPKKVLFVLSLLNGKPMVAGRNTAADGIIRLAGGVNAIDAYEGYKQIADEAVIAAGPDTVLVMQRQQEPLDARTAVRACGLRDDAGGGAANPSSRWTGFICSASARAPRPRRAISPPRSIRRSRARDAAVRAQAVRLPLMALAAADARLVGRRACARPRSCSACWRWCCSSPRRQPRASARPAFR